MKSLQFWELTKATFGCGRNTRWQSASVTHHERNLLNPGFPEIVDEVFTFFQERCKTGICKI
jgi:hypothetical protein